MFVRVIGWCVSHVLESGVNDMDYPCLVKTVTKIVTLCMVFDGWNNTVYVFEIGNGILKFRH